MDLSKIFTWDEVMQWLKNNNKNNIDYENESIEDKFNDMEWSLINKYFECINLEKQMDEGDLSLKFIRRVK